MSIVLENKQALVAGDGSLPVQMAKYAKENGYEYVTPETILLIDSWRDQAAIDAHHASPMMAVIAALREKYDLHMKAERFVSVEEPSSDERFIRK